MNLRGPKTGQTKKGHTKKKKTQACSEQKEELKSQGDLGLPSLH